MSQTKIVATIGPATNSAEALLALRDAGMDVVRLNGSHADLAWHAEAISLSRATLPQTPVLLDIPGRKIRTTQLASEPSFVIGDRIVLTADVDHDGTEKVPVSYEALHEAVGPGSVILADDGFLRFTVMEVSGCDVVCRAETKGTLRSRKGINVPGFSLDAAMVTDRDRQLLEFARVNGVDFVGISFVESAAHIQTIRGLIGGSIPRIVSKIENERGFANMAEVIGETDAVMIDRGDLSVETSFETVSLYQKRILDAANGAGKPVIVATEMLHSMVENAQPTKAEISDITNAVLDGCAATMLSGETAIGAHPVEAVRVMRRIADATVSHMQNVRDGPDRPAGSTVPEVMGAAIGLVCRALPITKIVAVTRSGYAARMIAASRPRQPILAVSDDAALVRGFNLFPGTRGIYVDVAFSRRSTDHIVTCLEALWRRGELVDDDFIVVTAVGYPRTGNRMNLMQTHQVADLADTLGWRG